MRLSEAFHATWDFKSSAHEGSTVEESPEGKNDSGFTSLSFVWVEATSTTHEALPAPLFIDENGCDTRNDNSQKSNLTKHLSPYLENDFWPFFWFRCLRRRLGPISKYISLAARRSFFGKQPSVLPLDFALVSDIFASEAERIRPNFAWEIGRETEKYQTRSSPRNLPFPSLHTLILLLNLFPPPTLSGDSRIPPTDELAFLFGEMKHK
jgi:hypothetical protein